MGQSSLSTWPLEFSLKKMWLRGQVSTSGYIFNEPSTCFQRKRGEDGAGLRVRVCHLGSTTSHIYFWIQGAVDGIEVSSCPEEFQKKKEQLLDLKDKSFQEPFNEKEKEEKRMAPKKGPPAPQVKKQNEWEGAEERQVKG